MGHCKHTRKSFTSCGQDNSYTLYALLADFDLCLVIISAVNVVMIAIIRLCCVMWYCTYSIVYCCSLRVRMEYGVVIAQFMHRSELYIAYIACCEISFERRYCCVTVFFYLFSSPVLFFLTSGALFVLFVAVNL